MDRPQATDLRTMIVALADAYAKSNRQGCTRDDFGAGYDAAMHNIAEALHDVVNKYGASGTQANNGRSCHHCDEAMPNGRCWWCGGPNVATGSGDVNRL